MLDESRTIRSLAVVLALGLAATMTVPLRGETAAERREAYLRSLASSRTDKATKDASDKAASASRTAQQAGGANSLKDMTAPKMVKLTEQGLQYTTVRDWMVVDLRGLSGTVGGVVYSDPAASRSKGGKGKQGTIFVRVMPIADGKTIDDVVAGVTKELNCCGPHYAIKPEAELPLAGEKARAMVFEPQEERVKDQKWYLAAAQHGAKAYVFMLFTHTGDYAATRPGVDKLLKSVKWLGAPVAPTPLPKPKPQPTTAPSATVPPAPAAAAAAPTPMPKASSGGDGLD